MGAYLESLLPHLSHCTASTQGLRPPVGEVTFSKDAVSIAIRHGKQPGDGNFNLDISCKAFDWQIDSAVQVCGALMSVFSIVEELTLGFDEQRMPSEWQNNVVDSIMWHGHLLPFTGVRKLRVDGTLARDLSSALEPDEAGLVLELLPELQEVEAQLEDEQASNAFSAFIVESPAPVNWRIGLCTCLSRQCDTHL